MKTMHNARLHTELDQRYRRHQGCDCPFAHEESADFDAVKWLIAAVLVAVLLGVWS